MRIVAPYSPFVPMLPREQDCYTRKNNTVGCLFGFPLPGDYYKPNVGMVPVNSRGAALDYVGELFRKAQKYTEYKNWLLYEEDLKQHRFDNAFAVTFYSVIQSEALTVQVEDGILGFRCNVEDLPVEIRNVLVREGCQERLRQREAYLKDKDSTFLWEAYHDYILSLWK